MDGVELAARSVGALARGRVVEEGDSGKRETRSGLPRRVGAALGMVRGIRGIANRELKDRVVAVGAVDGDSELLRAELARRGRLGGLPLRELRPGRHPRERLPRGGAS